MISEQVKTQFFIIGNNRLPKSDGEMNYYIQSQFAVLADRSYEPYIDLEYNSFQDFEKLQDADSITLSYWCFSKEQQKEFLQAVIEDNNLIEKYERGYNNNIPYFDLYVMDNEENYNQFIQSDKSQNSIFDKEKFLEYINEYHDKILNDEDNDNIYRYYDLNDIQE